MLLTLSFFLQDYNNMSKFLNRILGMPVELQNRLFKYFTDTLNAIIASARRSGRFDLGILDLGAHGESVTRVKRVRFMRKHATGVAPTELHLVHVEVCRLLNFLSFFSVAYIKTRNDAAC